MSDTSIDYLRAYASLDGERLASVWAEIDRLRARLDEWGIDGPPPITIKRERLRQSYHLLPSDTLHLHHRDETGETCLLKAEIGETMTVDEVTIFRIKDALGYVSAVLGAFGQGKE